MNWLDIEERLGSGVYPMRGLALVRGEGALVYDDTGRSYIDCVAGIGSANVGHAHPKIVQAIRQQAEALAICPGMFANDTRAKLLTRLMEVAPAGLERTFLCNSGAEAVEAAFKFARLSTGRTGIVAAMRGFHGRTMGALSATWNTDYRKPFEPLVDGFTHVPFDDLEALDQAVTSSTAAVVLEVVQGEGGVPMGAVLVSGRVGELPKKVHGSTLGGSPLACAAALATIDVLEDEGLVARAEVLGHQALDRFGRLQSQHVREVRGLGLFLAIELKSRAAAFVKKLQEQGILVLQAGPTVLRILPPLNITDEQFDRLLTSVSEVLTP